MSLLNIVAVAAGGAAGALARWGAHRGATAVHGVEAAWSTLAVNVAGAFGLGLFAMLLAERSGPLSLLVLVGFFGAFTTFSTFAMDAVDLVQQRGLVVAGLYVGLSVGLAIAAFLAGAAAGRALA